MTSTEGITMSTERKVYIAGIGWVACRGNSYYRVK
ncbi:hypothetical protein SEA_SUPERCHUNK_98 [Mycobacterium phage Superchunk]|nr:hypothetical protein SEA_SUPERCHUNK_98 [Mycobacterium phage Superchunk]